MVLNNGLGFLGIEGPFSVVLGMRQVGPPSCEKVETVGRFPKARQLHAASQSQARNATRFAGRDEAIPDGSTAWPAEVQHLSGSLRASPRFSGTILELGGLHRPHSQVNSIHCTGRSRPAPSLPNTEKPTLRLQSKCSFLPKLRQRPFGIGSRPHGLFSSFDRTPMVFFPSHQEPSGTRSAVRGSCSGR